MSETMLGVASARKRKKHQSFKSPIFFFFVGGAKSLIGELLVFVEECSHSPWSIDGDNERNGTFGVVRSQM